MFDRSRIVEELIEADVDYTHEDEGLNFIIKDMLVRYLKEGFKGYNNMTDEELIQECEDRDISYLFGNDD